MWDTSNSGIEVNLFTIEETVEEEDCWKRETSSEGEVDFPPVQETIRDVGECETGVPTWRNLGLRRD